MQNTGLMRRIAAILYDGLLLFAVLMLTALPFIAIRDGEAVEPRTDLFYRITLAAVIYIFFVGFWARSGRTLGMQSWRLQLETANGRGVTLGAATGTGTITDDDTPVTEVIFLDGFESP